MSWTLKFFQIFQEFPAKMQETYFIEILKKLLDNYWKLYLWRNSPESMMLFRSHTEEQVVLPSPAEILQDDTSNIEAKHFFFQSVNATFCTARILLWNNRETNSRQLFTKSYISSAASRKKRIEQWENVAGHGPRLPPPLFVVLSCGGVCSAGGKLPRTSPKCGPWKG